MKHKRADTDWVQWCWDNSKWDTGFEKVYCLDDSTHKLTTVFKQLCLRQDSNPVSSVPEPTSRHSLNATLGGAPVALQVRRELRHWAQNKDIKETQTLPRAGTTFNSDKCYIAFLLKSNRASQYGKKRQADFNKQVSKIQSAFHVSLPSRHISLNTGHSFFLLHTSQKMFFSCSLWHLSNAHDFIL